MPDTVKEKLEIRPVDTVDDLLQEVFGPVIHLTEGEHYQMVGMLPVPVRSGSASESVLQA
ncbi:hypothetical protein SDC9_120549 [bioreactor metagenome]|uniref:Uncharacterized protein n=1 Tax=bioreactor metagenome TaxID=1076179 RepID=A0A645C860_9ZZZZ